MIREDEKMRNLVRWRRLLRRRRMDMKTTQEKSLIKEYAYNFFLRPPSSLPLLLSWPKKRLCRSQSRQITGTFLQSSELGPPLTRRRVCFHPPPPVPEGRTHSRGGGESQYGRGDKHCGTLSNYAVWCSLSILVHSVVPMYWSARTLSHYAQKPQRNCSFMNSA
jgi:hypothetical protein